MLKAATVVALLALAAGGSVASAQTTSAAKPQTREGFTFAIGLGTGSVALTCDGCDEDERENGGTGFLRFGGAYRPNLILSGQTRGWMKTEDDTKVTVGMILFGAQWYPQVASGWYVEGGIGVGSNSIEDEFNDIKIEAVGAALSLGTGYDIRVARNFSLTPFVSFSGIAGGDAKLNGTTPTPSFTFGSNLFQLGLAFTWH